MNGGWGAGLGFMKNSLLRERGGVHKWKWVVKFWKICNRFSPPPLTITLPRLLRVGNVVKIFQASLEDFDN